MSDEYEAIEEGIRAEMEIGDLRDLVRELADALERISAHEYRADRRHRGMVDVSEVQDLQRIATVALARARTVAP